MSELCRITIVCLFALSIATTVSAAEEIAKHGFANSGDVRIHYVTAGEGPLLVMVHGLKDQALLEGALSGTWNWVEKDLTLVTIPNAGHFVQQDASDKVTRTMRIWLTQESDE